MERSLRLRIFPCLLYTSITIIAPTPYKKKIEEQKLDPDTKAPILDKDGKIVTEEKEIEIPMFRPRCV